MRTGLLRFPSAAERDPAIVAWRKTHAGELGAIAHRKRGVLSRRDAKQLIDAAYLDIKARVENDQIREIGRRSCKSMGHQKFCWESVE